MSSFDFKKRFKGVVSVIGASTLSKEDAKKVIEIGRLLAKNHYVVSCGGLSGAMEAVCKGAKKAGGLTIGIIPHKHKIAANQYVDIAIPVPFSQARNIIVVLSGDIVLAIGGKAGTLSEIAFSWIYGKKVVSFTDIEGWASKLAGSQIDDRRPDKIYEANTPEEVIEKINLLFKEKNDKMFSATEEF